ncbi:MAG TPA: hypothetical protein VG820_03040 [Fimbriimonadaceae bacterium]|nr:hypothetical protein [Fimbriimonadaceae bacterium]
MKIDWQRAARRVRSPEELAGLLTGLRDDLLEDDERWQNHKLNIYLEAVAAWLAGRRSLVDDRPETWRGLALLLYDAKVLGLPGERENPETAMRLSGALVYGVTAKNGFAAFCKAMAQDQRDFPEAWRDASLDRYLDALAARIRESSRRYGLGPGACRQAAEVISAARSYDWGGGSKVYRRLEKVGSPETLAGFILALRRDFTDFHDEWVHWSLADYLEGMTAWREDDADDDGARGVWDRAASFLALPLSGTSPPTSCRELRALVLEFGRGSKEHPERWPVRTIEEYLGSLAAFARGFPNSEAEPAQLWRLIAEFLYTGKIYE